MKGNLSLVHSRKSVDPMGEAADADGFVATQLYGKTMQDFMHIVATRVPQQNYRHLQKFQTDMEKVLCEFDGWILDIHSLLKLREVVLIAYVPANVSKEAFAVVTERFKKALHDAKIILYPMDCEVESDLRQIQ